MAEISGRLVALRRQLGLEESNACQIEDVECYEQVTDVMDAKLKEMRAIIEKQKKHYAFRTHSYEPLDKALSEVGY